MAEDLLRREEELSRNKRERDKLLQKLGTIERQIIVGGENMLEKVELQAQLLEQSNRWGADQINGGWEFDSELGAGRQILGRVN